MKNDFQLDHFVVTRMHTDWVLPENLAKGTIEQIEANFSCEILRHQDRTREFRVEFAGKFSQETAKGIRLGFDVEVRLVALVSVSEAVPEEKLGEYVHVNSVSALYGTIRGLVASATGVFPSGPLILPSTSPKEIFESMRRDEAERAKKNKPKPAKSIRRVWVKPVGRKLGKK
ncbi:MAG: hypothetical protein ABSE62_14455 [Chthoniobacteraceae bacterium]|jgi:hypothetical protein